MVILFLEEVGNFDFNFKDKNGNMVFFYVVKVGNFNILNVFVIVL